MRAVIYERTGGPEVLQLVDREPPSASAGEAVVRLHRAGVNPTDWKSRRGSGSGDAVPAQVPGQDGAGVVESVGDGVDAALVGQRVWVWEAAWQRPHGTAQEQARVLASHLVALPDDASYELGASLGIPFLTAHRCLTVTELGPERLRPGALSGRTVLVAGGAGAVGNAAIQLARWADATVITTVSSPAKGLLAAAAGADHVIDYHAEDVVARVRAIAPDGVDAIVEVAPAANAAIDVAVLASGGAIAAYANDADDVAMPVRPQMMINARWQFVMVYTEPAPAKAAAVGAVSAAVAAGAIRVGEQAGLPLLHYPLDQTAEAHRAVESGALGKVLIDVV